MTPAGVTSARVTARGMRGAEGVAVDREGNLYGGGEDGVVRRLSRDGTLSEVARVSDGQLGGLAFDRDENLFVCDGFNGRVMRVTAKGAVSVFAQWAGRRRLHVPNFPVFDAAGDLWVTDSFDRPLAELDFAAEYARPRPAGALVRLRGDGRGEVVLDHLYMPNGLAIDPDERWLYLLQTTLCNCVRIPLHDAEPRPQAHGGPLGSWPDGMAVAADGALYITLPEARRVVVLDSAGEAWLVAEDPDGAVLAFPTNCAFVGPDFDELVVATMRVDHFGVLAVSRRGHPLINRRP